MPLNPSFTSYTSSDEIGEIAIDHYDTPLNNTHATTRWRKAH